jgi:hypothetical protein
MRKTIRIGLAAAGMLAIAPAWADWEASSLCDDALQRPENGEPREDRCPTIVVQTVQPMGDTGSASGEPNADDREQAAMEELQRIWTTE